MIGRELAGRYRVLEKLGEGGMGEVYLVEHKHLARKEALKVLLPRWSNTPEAVSRFRREARAANRLQHPNLITVYDFGQLPDGRFFLTTEFAEGEALDVRLNRVGQYAIAPALGLLAQAADAIDHAHERGVIHRDLKPANMVLVPRRGGQGDLLKILDFGIAKIIAPDYDDSLAGTDPSGAYGTPAYMAPEQVKGNGTEPRMDIYALGCVAFELLTGQAPFVGRWVQLMAMQLDAEPPHLRERRPDVPPALDAIVARCLEKDPDRRFQTGAELREALEHVPGFPERESSSGRRSSRAIGRDQLAALLPGSDFEAIETEEGLPGEMRRTDPSLVDSTAPTMAVGPSHTTLAFQAVLRRMAETLIDRGCNDFQLTVGTAEIASVEGELERLEAEAEEIQTRTAATEQRGREYEASIRFAIGELRFEDQQARSRGEQIDEQVRFQLTKLEQRLGEVARETAHELDELTERAIALAADKAVREDELAGLYTTLRRLAGEIAPRYSQQDEHIATLLVQLHRLDAHIETDG